MFVDAKFGIAGAGSSALLYLEMPPGKAVESRASMAIFILEQEGIQNMQMLQFGL